MTRSRILLLVALPVITAAIAGITFLVGASNRSQGTSPWTGSVPVSSASDGNDALRAAGEAGSVEPTATAVNAVPLPITDPSKLPPPPRNQFIRPDTGRFEAVLWDDRALPAARKAVQPWYDPRWKPFSACMTAEGYDVRADPTRPFSQQDLDTIVAGANAQLPTPDANKRIGGNTAGVPGIAGAFLRCGGRWLAWAPEAYGLARLEPGQVPAP